MSISHLLFGTSPVVVLQVKYPCGAGLILIVFVKVPSFARDVVLLKIPTFPPLYDRRRVIYHISYIIYNI